MTVVAILFWVCAGLLVYTQVGYPSCSRCSRGSAGPAGQPGAHPKRVRSPPRR